ncbi:hypothetical protein [Streptomyces sp. NBC_00989]|uniref:NucA/NucB deoxyribonuclease domain-containing protein n=1 Tax=Streptomyces sp. NBC_00989 TaxID=2903705 RepID=UPI003870C2EA|nr:hypothetical protein OG714_43750 [Streptomyces sp. NBC_00989]
MPDRAIKSTGGCIPNYGTASLDCDEFPFATTYEGAARHAYDATAPADDFSAEMTDSAENQAGGSQLGVYYGYNRLAAH